MKKFVSIYTCLSMIILLVVGNVACTKQNSMNTPLNMVPLESFISFEYADIGQIFQNSSLSEYYDALRSEDSDAVFGYITEEIDTTLRYSSGSNGDITIISGSFTIDTVRSALVDLGYDADTYKNVELWLSTDSSFALIESKKVSSISLNIISQNNMVVIGTTDGIKKCIDAKNDEIESLWDNRASGDVLNGLSDELWVWYGSDAAGIGYPGLIASAVSIGIMGSDELKANQVFKFEEAADALGALTQLQIDNSLQNIEVKQNGEDLTIDADADINYLNPRVDPPLMDETDAELQQKMGEFVQEWIEVENWINDSTRTLAKETSPWHRLKALENLGQISADTFETLNTLRGFRNDLVHGNRIINQQELDEQLNALLLVKQELPLNV